MTGRSATGTYLDAIVRDVRARLDTTPGFEPARCAGEIPGPIRSMHQAIAASNAVGQLAVIAEVKRRSPSVGSIDDAADPAAVAVTYEQGGAAGISVLTEPDHFGGSIEDLRSVRTACPATPVLRKDFVLEPRQLEAARAAGADAVLLIAALHPGDGLRSLVERAVSLDLEVLLEVHDADELGRALQTSARLIGINNRDLTTFEVDLATTERLAPLVPADRLVVAESGVRTAADARRMHSAGAHAVLVGEALMRATDPAKILRDLRGA